MKIGKYKVTVTDEFKENFDIIVGGIGAFIGMFVIIAICCFVL